MILTVGNLKGGVGKSTLAMSLCNYFSKLGREVQLLDLGVNSPIAGLYEEELMERMLLPYEVKSFSLESSELHDEKLMEIKRSETITVVDLPSILTAKHKELLVLSDLNVIPFEYSLLTLKGTMRYLNYLKLFETTSTTILLRWKLDSRRVYRNQLASDLMLMQGSSILMQPVFDFSALTEVSVGGMTKEQRKPLYRAFDELLVYVDEIKEVSIQVLEQGQAVSK